MQKEERGRGRDNQHYHPPILIFVVVGIFLMVNEADLHDNSIFGTFSALHFTAFKIKHKKYGIDFAILALLHLNLYGSVEVYTFCMVV
jgi:hypothetical protein